MTCRSCEKAIQDRNVAVCKNIALMDEVKGLQAEVNRLRRENERLLPDPSKPILVVNGEPVYPRQPGQPATLRVHLEDGVLEGEAAFAWLREKRRGS